MNSYFRLQFNYCPLTWMCHSRTNNRKINRLHERCLRIIYNDKQASFIKLLEKDNSLSKSVSFLGPVIWDLVSNELTDKGNLASFKKVIKK